MTYKEIIASFNLSIPFDSDGFINEEELFNLYPENFVLIDRFPMIINKTMEWFSPLDVFFTRKEQTVNEYFEVERKYINTLTILSCYSPLWVQSSFYFSKRLPDYLSEEERNYLIKIKDYLFIQVNTPIELACLLKLSLRGYEQTIIYLPELKVIAWVNELIVSLYYQDEKSRKLIEMITTTEGLYLRKK
ncbi:MULTISPECIES: hypothetical protein [Ureibacillus]|jgi:hypothetical protein|uniref:Uncharacterized protein n=2 Tax=Ureibacillus TaxID=160795 RepID=A0A840Q5A7_URETH|nr:hypothetical protein [Ureibacillus thermosphaericus]MBB5150156.1 hypothetical protein [Ureibacillus thermosphaericus]NKZ32743.1 hypothetical protein [Ureibacillus thermosphaericus]